MTEISPKSPNNRSLVVLLGAMFIVLVVALYGAFTVLPPLLSGSNNSDGEDATVYTGTVYEPPVELENWTLPASTGEPLSLVDLRGRYVLLFFGFTHCPDVCPLTLAEFRRVKAILGDAAGDVTFLFVSVDSPRDTPEVVAEYLARFDEDFVGVTGDHQTLQQIGPQYDLFFELPSDPDVEANYEVTHTGRSYVIDPNGQLRMSFSYGTDAETIAAGIKGLMQSAG